MGYKIKESENIIQLRKLVDELDKQDKLSDEYHRILKDIEDVINDERNVISKLKRNDVKLQHYEGICKNILSIISSVRV